MKKAYSMSSIAIVAVIAVAFFLAWMNYQSTAGVDYTERISDNQDALRSKMETVKSISEPILEHASNDAALTIAKAGGGMGTERVWFCNGVRTPPTFHEILYFLSNETLNNLNAYLDDSTDIYDVLNVNIEPYTCSGIYPEVAYQCPQTNYPEACDGWDITGLGGSLYSKEDGTTHKYIGDIKGRAEYNRFFWMYYRLLEAEMEDSILMEVKNMHDSQTDCDPQTDCEDRYVCRYDYGAGEICLNPCDVTCETVLDPPDCDKETDPDCNETEVCTHRNGTHHENPCVDGKGTVTCGYETDPNCCCISTGQLKSIFNLVEANSKFYGHFDEYVTCTVEKECIEAHSISIKITCVDRKYKIPADNETGEKYLTWVIKEMISVGCDYSECIGISTCTGTANPGTTTPSTPPADMSRHNTIYENKKADLFFKKSENAYCNEHMACFDIYACNQEFNEELCFNPPS